MFHCTYYYSDNVLTFSSCKAENQTQIPPAEVHICQLKDEEKLQMCKEAMEYPIAVQSKIQFVNDTKVGEVKTYEVALGGWAHLNKPPIYVSACLCPTDPPIYFRDNSSGVFVDSYLGFRQAYGEVPDTSLPGFRRKKRSCVQYDLNCWYYE
mgnify:CR=1 FL=1